jgi:peptidoglycan/LPS O-acetylase OafA/YrhL
VIRTRTSPSTSSETKTRDLEGYRGLAALGIVVFHAYQFNRGDVGSHYAYMTTPLYPLLRNLDGLVSLFFVLSGYLMYLPLARKVSAGSGGGPVRVFVLRRAVRILPLYWSAVLIVWAARNPRLPGDWRDLLEHLTCTQVFDSKRIFYTIGPAWSLSVEVFFYVFLALVYAASNSAWVTTMSPAGRRMLLWLVPATLAVAGVAWKAWAVYIAHEPATRWAIWFNPLAKADMFAVGMLIVMVQTARRDRAFANSAVAFARLSAVALLVVGAAVRTDEPAAASTFAVLSTIAFGLLIMSSVLGRGNSLYRRALSHAWLGRLGLISYSLYVWHEPVLLFLNSYLHIDHAPAMFPVTALLLLGAAIPVAVASYHAVEQPFSRLRLVLRSDGRFRDLYAA